MDVLHERFSVTSYKKACRCSPGKNLKKREMDWRSIVGFPLSKGRFPLPRSQGFHRESGIQTKRKMLSLNRLGTQPTPTYILGPYDATGWIRNRDCGK